MAVTSLHIVWFLQTNQLSSTAMHHLSTGDTHHFIRLMGYGTIGLKDYQVNRLVD